MELGVGTANLPQEMLPGTGHSEEGTCMTPLLEAIV
jgi:hypothetical protein